MWKVWKSAFVEKILHPTVWLAFVHFWQGSEGKLKFIVGKDVSQILET